MKTIIAKYKTAIELLRLVLLQNDEKDELQLSIEKFLIDNGEIPSNETKILKLTKKDFKELINVQKYGRGRDENNVYAIFSNWQSSESGKPYWGGYKYCIFARACNATKEELFNILYEIVTGKREDTPWYTNIVMAQTNEQRFKIPLSSGGLNCMIKYDKTVTK
jgi:hypothetical protein